MLDKRFWRSLAWSSVGITAFPLQTELNWLITSLHADALRPIAQFTNLLPQIERVNEGLDVTNAHLVLAIAFIGPYLDPVRNKWVISFGLVSCAGVLPLALIAGHLTEIGVMIPLKDATIDQRQLLTEIRNTKLLRSGGVVTEENGERPAEAET